MKSNIHGTAATLNNKGARKWPFPGHSEFIYSGGKQLREGFQLRKKLISDRSLAVLRFNGDFHEIEG